ncbi:MAG: sporulation protein YqfD [Peptococcales bacterium]
MRWYSYLVGYLIIIIEGQFPEKVINMALTRGIFLWDIKQIGENRISMKIRLYAFRPLARISRACSCRIKVYDRRGLPFQIKLIKRRKTLALGSLLFFLSIYILTSFVWVIDVKGNEDLTTSEIKELASHWGLKPGVVRKKIDIDKLETALLDAHPKLAWVGISIQGTKVTIEISEKVLIPETDDHNYAHLVAKESGIIKEMLVLVGTPQVKEGDQIKQGQILISGLVYPEIHLNEDGTHTPAGEPTLVRAKGVVRAIVKLTRQNSCEFLETEITKTGMKSEQVLLKIGKEIIVLKGEAQSPYKYYDLETTIKTFPSWRNIQVPVELITNVFWEEKRLVNSYGQEEAYHEAIRRAEKDLSCLLTDDAKVLEKSVQIIPIDREDKVVVEVTWKILENIAVPYLISNVGTQ